MKAPIRVAVTGAAGNIGYAIIFRIAAGDLFGQDQPVILQLLERNAPDSLQKLKGLEMELMDCAFPTLAGTVLTIDPKVAFKDADAAFLIGSRPRTKGMERAELLAANGAIFTEQGKAINEVASRNVHVLVVGNPCNTNCYIAMKSAPSLSPKCFSAMLRLDHNRSLAQLSAKTGKPAVLTEFAVYNLATVGKRGAAVIEARGASSAASAASAAIDHMRDWFLGTNGEWVTMGVPSDGSYGIPEGIVCGMPVICDGKGGYEIVKDLPVDEFSQAKLDVTVGELKHEADLVKDLI